MSTDRPDKTESAYTLSPGRFQFEATAFSYADDKTDENGNKVETTTKNISDFQLRAGLTENGEAQVMMPALVEERVRTSEGASLKSGAGDITVRYRQNMHGNSGEEDFAWAIMPYLKLPTAGKDFSNDRVEGGMMFPFALNLSQDWSMGTMLNLKRAYTDETESWRTDYIVTWVISKKIISDVSGFAEIYSEISDDKDLAPIGTFDLGLTWQYSPDFQFDIGSFIGITEAAVDNTAFMGIAWRI